MIGLLAIVRLKYISIWQFIQKCLFYFEKTTIDGVEGYVEDGREIFDDDLDEESIKKNQKNGTKRNRFGTKISVEPPRDNIKKMIASMPMKRKREVSL